MCKMSISSRAVTHNLNMKKLKKKKSPKGAAGYFFDPTKVEVDWSNALLLAVRWQPACWVEVWGDQH